MVLTVIAGYAAALVTGTLNGPLTLVSAALVGGLAAWTIVRRGVRVARHDLLVTVSQLSLAAALALAGVVALSHVDFAVSQVAGYGYEAGLAAAALLLAAASGSEARTRAMLADLVVMELGRARRPETVRGALARALGDRSLQVGYWVSAAGRYVDADGFTVTLPNTSDQRAAIVVERDGEPVAALVHDPAVLEDPSLSEAVREATALLFANSRLEAELATQLAELRASRGRIVQARDQQRRRLARLLQDGAERRLVEVGAAVARARASATPDVGDLDLLDVLGRELELARVELGALARGIHPRALTEKGLAAALSALVDRTSIPIELIAPAERMPAPIEAAAYFVCSEAFTNVTKYAHASHVRCEVRRRDDRVAVAVVDDGVGGADPGAGSGLRGLADRIDALGGRFTVTSPAGKGTTISAELPLEGSC
jgi:signal transduction histidine kinase